MSAFCGADWGKKYPLFLRGGDAEEEFFHIDFDVPPAGLGLVIHFAQFAQKLPQRLEAVSAKLLAKFLLKLRDGHAGLSESGLFAVAFFYHRLDAEQPAEMKRECPNDGVLRVAVGRKHPPKTVKRLPLIGAGKTVYYLKSVKDAVVANQFFDITGGDGFGWLLK